MITPAFLLKGLNITISTKDHWQTDDLYYYIINNFKVPGHYLRTRFKTLDIMREEKINEILSHS